MWWMYKDEVLRKYLESKSVEELAQMWLEAKIGAYSSPAGIFFDVLESKPDGKKIARKLWHQQGDLAASYMAKQRVCLVPNKKGACPFPLEEAI